MMTLFISTTHAKAHKLIILELIRRYQTVGAWINRLRGIELRTIYEATWIDQISAFMITSIVTTLDIRHNICCEHPLVQSGFTPEGVKT
jgi:hypothetical protein